MRVQVSLSDDMVKAVDTYAAQMGVSRSALCSVLIGQGVMSYKETFRIVEEIAAKAASEGVRLEGQQLSLDNLGFK